MPLLNYDSQGIGDSQHSYAYQADRNLRLHRGRAEYYGRIVAQGSIVGAMLDMEKRTMHFYVDGELLVDGRGGVTAFAYIPEGRWVPALSLGPGTEVEVNLGSRPSTLHHLHSGSCQPVAICNEFKVRPQ